MSYDFSMPLNQAMMTQRAIRRVTDQQVDDELLLEIIQLGSRAPNSMNKQSWEFIIVRDRAVKEKLARCELLALVRNRVRSGPHE